MKLDKYRVKLLAKKSELLADLKRAGAGGREQPEPGAVDSGDESVLDVRKEDLFAQADRDFQTMKDVDEALARIEDGTYGRCAEDGQIIPEARLEAVPWARYCIKHQEQRDAQSEQREPTL
jgi:DnaK suppressor protein